MLAQSGNTSYTREITWSCENKKNENNICYLEGQATRRKNSDSKKGKKVKKIMMYKFINLN